MIIAVDVDGTLIDTKGKPRNEIIALVKALSVGNEVIVWSGGGIEYASRWVEKLGITQYVALCAYKNPKVISKLVDIAIDDTDVKLGKHNIKV